MSDLKISLEVSMYPLTENYLPAIDHFLEIVHNTDGLKVKTNPMSTQVFGEASLVFKTVQSAITEVYSSGKQTPFSIKILNGDVSDMEIKNFKHV